MPTVLFLLACLAQPSEDSDVAKGWLKVSREQADGYVIGPVAAPDQRYRPLPQAVFRHSQPARGNDVGAVYLWVDTHDRPVAVGDIFAWSVGGNEARNVTHEFHSLADGPLDVRHEGARHWSPKSAGLAWQPIPDAPAPGASKTVRSRQARELSRRFAAESIDHEGGRWELRLVPQPVHQYDLAEPKTWQSGALFAVCQGTDPELWLALESRRTDAGFRWHYACASFTDYALRVRLDDKQVWSCERHDHTATEGPHWAATLLKDVRLAEETKAP